MPAGLLATVFVLMGPQGPVGWSFIARYDAEGLLTISATASVQEGWHIYATRLENDLGPIPTSIRFEAIPELIPVGDLAEPTPEEAYDPNFQMQVHFHSGSPVFTQRFKPAVYAELVVKGEVEYMVCNDKTCLPPVVVPFMLTIPPETKP